MRWNPPTTTHVAPSRRPMSIASDSSRCAPEDRLRSASKTRARPMIVRPWMFFRSELTVSAMPVPIQSSAGSRVMLANVMTATESLDRRRRRRRGDAARRAARQRVELVARPRAGPGACRARTGSGTSAIFSSARATTASNDGGTAACSATAAAAISCRMWSMISVGDPPSNGIRPVAQLEQHDAEREEIGAVIDRRGRAPAPAPCRTRCRRPSRPSSSAAA